MLEPRLEDPNGDMVPFSQLPVAVLAAIVSAPLIPLQSSFDPSFYIQFARDYAARLLRERGM